MHIVPISSPAWQQEIEDLKSAATLTAERDLLDAMRQYRAAQLFDDEYQSIATMRLLQQAAMGRGIAKQRYEDALQHDINRSMPTLEWDA